MTEKDRLKSLIVAIDGSEGGNAAVAEAIALARDLPAALTFVFVRKPPSSMLGFPLPERHVSYDLRRARETIGVAIETATAAGVESDGEILEGDVADEIVSFADNRQADLIVVGSRGHGALAGACWEVSPGLSCNTLTCPCSSRNRGRSLAPKWRKRGHGCTKRSTHEPGGGVMKGRRLWEIGGFIAGGVLILFGAAAIYMGADGYQTVRDELDKEYIVGGSRPGPRRPGYRIRSSCRRATLSTRRSTPGVRHAASLSTCASTRWRARVV
jgi:nucleotide-binding universal stress UspA family protein